MLRLSQFPHPRKATTLNQKTARRFKDKIELCLGIDPTRNEILIKVINDEVAGRFSTMELKHDLHSSGTHSY